MPTLEEQARADEAGKPIDGGDTNGGLLPNFGDQVEAFAEEVVDRGMQALCKVNPLACAANVIMQEGKDNGEQSSKEVGFDTSNLQNKLEGYLLDSSHPQNQTKANWFEQALGFDKNNWQDLASQIKFDEAIAIPTKSTEYGQTFEQTVPISGANGNTINTTFVFMKDTKGVVRLVTGIPTKNENPQRE